MSLNLISCPVAARSVAGRSWPARLLVLLAAISMLTVPARTSAAERRTQNVIVVSTDGLRWEEVFNGVEEILLNETYGNVSDTNAFRTQYWRPTPEARRELLFPFLWGTVAKKGQLWGNRVRGSDVRVSNGLNFSYPGYNEFLTGYADPKIDSNDKKLNTNTNVLEWLNSRPGFQGRVAATVNWDVLPWILNGPRAGFPIWSGFEVPAGTKRLPVPEALTDLVEHGRTVWSGVLLDTFVGYAARHALQSLKPRVLYVQFGETDDWAHEGRYERVIWAAHEFDRFLGRIWEMVQSTPGYKDATTLLVTVDHGRGAAPEDWRGHGRQLAPSAYIWFGVIGPDTEARGERSNTPAVVQAQIASTIAALVGEDFRAASPKAAPLLPDVIGPAVVRPAVR